MATQEQLNARLNPTAFTVQLPTEGLFYFGGRGDAFNGTLLKQLPDGHIQQIDIVQLLVPQAERASIGNFGQQIRVASDRLRTQFGINTNTLKAVNAGDFFQALQNSGKLGYVPGGGQAFINAAMTRTDNISDFLGVNVAQLQQQQLNTQQNQLASDAQIAASQAATEAQVGTSQEVGGQGLPTVPDDLIEQVRQQIQSGIATPELGVKGIMSLINAGQYSGTEGDIVQRLIGGTSDTTYATPSGAIVTQGGQLVAPPPGNVAPSPGGTLAVTAGGTQPSSTPQTPSSTTTQTQPSTTSTTQTQPSTTSTTQTQPSTTTQAQPTGATPLPVAGDQPLASAGNLDLGGEAGVPSGGTPYFMGDFSLVRFIGQGPAGYMPGTTIWLLDPNSNTLRPFENPEALSSFFDSPVDLNDIQSISATELMPGGMLGSQNGESGFELLGKEYAINADGTAKRLDFSASQLATRYGHPINEQAELEGSSSLQGFLTLLMNTDSGIDSNTIQEVLNNRSQLGFYANAVLYGDYFLTDIYKDIKARELGLGDEFAIISPTIMRSQYQKTPEGQAALNDNRISPPTSIGNLSMDDLNLSIFNLPDEAFKTLIPMLDIESDEFKQRMNEVESAYHDILVQQINAGTEQEKAIADHNWQQFRTDLENTYGIQLSDNAFDAWSQIEGAYDQFAQRNIFGSGIQNEAIDDYLQKVRRQDQNLREEEMTQEERERMNYYINFATSEQIKDLINTEPELAKNWGLLPSDEVRNNLSLATLKAKYPNEDEATLQRYITSVLDENGNYRSNLLQRQMSSVQGIESEKRLFQQQMTLEQSLREEEKASRQFTTPDSPFLRDIDENDINVKPFIPKAPSDLVNLTSAISGANLGGTPTAGGTPTTTSTLSTIQGGISDAYDQAEKIRQSIEAAKTTTPTPVTGGSQRVTSANIPTVTPPTIHPIQPTTQTTTQPTPQITPTSSQLDFSILGANAATGTPTLQKTSSGSYAPIGNQPYVPGPAGQTSPTPLSSFNVQTSTPSSLPPKTGTTTGVLSAIGNIGKKLWGNLTSLF